jgi:hypothetical protein
MSPCWQIRRRSPPFDFPCPDAEKAETRTVANESEPRRPAGRWMLSGCSLVTRVRQVAEADDGELWSPLLIAGEFHGDVDDTAAAMTLGLCRNKLPHDNARDQQTVRQTRYSPEGRLFVSAARVQIGEANLPRSCDGLPSCLTDLGEGANGLARVLTHVSPRDRRSMPPGCQGRSWLLSTAWGAPGQVN